MIIRKMGLMRMKAPSATRMSKLRFDTPPTGGAPVAYELKYGELADRVADFIEMAPLGFAIGSVPSDAAHHPMRTVWSQFVFWNVTPRARVKNLNFSNHLCANIKSS